MTASVTHLWRLLKWGRTLARHGALQGIERDALTPPDVRRLVRVARFGLRMPQTVDYAAALQEIGYRAYTAHRLARRWRDHEERMLEELGELWGKDDNKA